jgi:2-dehydropantoate 2-reductase
MRVAVVGAGGVGGYFGGRLAEAGHDVGFVARGAHLEALRAGGLQVASVAGDFAVPRALATDDARDIGPVDLVLVCVKAWQVVEAAGAIPPLLGPDTAVLPLQNGVESADELAARLGRERVLGGVARIISYVAGPGRIHHAAHPPHIFTGELDRPRSPRVERIAHAFRVRGVTCEAADDIRAEMWLKFVFVAGWGAVAALAGVPCGPLRELSGSRRLLLESMGEIADVALARGVHLPADAVARSMALLESLPPEATVSLQRDLAAGVPSEIDGWSGAVVRLGEAAGVATPIHRLARDATWPRELGARGLLRF